VKKFIQADFRKFLISTTERKKMSTKTLRKRIALVAVAALGTGLLSVTPAFAGAGTATAIAISKATESPTGTALSAGYYTSDTVRSASAVSSISVTAGKTVSLRLIAVGGTTTTDDSYKIAMRTATTNYGYVVAVASAPALASAGESTLAAFTAPSTAGTYYLDVTLAKAGVYASATDLTTTVTMVVTAASTFSTGTSYAYANDTDTTGAVGTSTTDGVITGIKTLNAVAGNISIQVNNADNTVCTGCSVGGYITGSGYIAVGTAALAASAVASSVAATPVRSLTALAVNASGFASIAVFGDGTAGTGTINITVTNAAGDVVAFTTKTVKFYGSVTKIELVKQPYKVLRAGGYTSGIKTGLGASATITLASSPAFVIKATDANGNVVGGLTFATSSYADTSIVSAVSYNEDTVTNDALSNWGGVGYYVFDATSATSSASGKSSKVTVRIVDPADATKYISTDVSFSIGGTVAKETISFDKSSYQPGEAMAITLKGVDSAGNPVYDNAASPAVTFSKSVGGSFGAGNYAGGKVSSTTATPSVWAPAVAGPFVATFTSGNTAGDTVTGSASVADTNAAASAATTAQIASLIAKINALASLIAKIQKKLGVK